MLVMRQTLWRFRGTWKNWNKRSPRSENVGRHAHHQPEHFKVTEPRRTGWESWRKQWFLRGAHPLWI